MNKEILIAIRREHSPGFPSLTFVVVGSRVINWFTVINADMICNCPNRNHTPRSGDPCLVALSGGGELEHVFLFLVCNKPTFERHRIIPDPECRITASATGSY